MDIGIPFGKYELLHRLARGGMAEVFKAVQHGPNGFERIVALKRILPHLANLPEFLELFMDEARLAARLSHPNIVHIYEFGRIGDSYFIAMEFVDGVDLTRLFLEEQRDPLPLEHAARIIAEVCGALHYAHNLKGTDNQPLNLVHRDISPPNIMVSYSGAVRVLDFGIAKAVHHVDRTQPGLIRGKYTHMAPEQVSGAPIDGRSDLFCAGIVLYELCTGQNLLPRNDPMEAMRMIERGNFPKVLRNGVPLPPLLDQILTRCLAIRKEDRYPSAADMQFELEAFLRSAVQISNSITLGNYFQQHYPPKEGPGPIKQPIKVEGPKALKAVHGEIGGTAKHYGLYDVTLPPFPREASLRPENPPSTLEVLIPRDELARQVPAPDINDPGADESYIEDPDIDLLTPIHRPALALPSLPSESDLSVKSTIILSPPKGGTGQEDSKHLGDQRTTPFDHRDTNLESSPPYAFADKTVLLTQSAFDRPRSHMTLLLLLIGGVTIAGIYTGYWISKLPSDQAVASNRQEAAQTRDADIAPAQDSTSAVPSPADSSSPATPSLTDSSASVDALPSMDTARDGQIEQKVTGPVGRKANKKNQNQKHRKQPHQKILQKIPAELSQPTAKAIPPLQLQLGGLRINSKPWSRVILNGTDMGITPFAKYQLPAGVYQLRLVNGSGQTFNKRIVIIPDKITKIKHTFP